MNNQRTTNIIGWILFIIVLAVYLFTLEPVASFWDSGEYIASSYKLEIPHPPGGPLFLLLGRMFSFFSLGNEQNVAMTINSLSAVSSALTIVFLFWTIVRICKKVIPSSAENLHYLSWGAGIIGALSFAFTDTFWYSATETELYGIATLFIAFVFWAIFKWEEKEDESEGNRWLILICFVIGLSVGIHLLSLLAIPSLGLVYYFKKYKKTNARGLAIAMLCSGTFLLFVLYGLVTLANISKFAEIWLVNSFGMPFGSGVLLIVVLVLSAIVYAIHYSIKTNRVTLNTVLLGLSFVMIGYMSYGVVLIRANFAPPINQNDPRNVLGLIYYLNMEQYPSRPLLFGKYFNAPLQGYEKGKPIYSQRNGRYEITDHKVEYQYPDEYQTIFPRAYNSMKPEFADEYRIIMGLRKGEKPSFSDNLTYLIKHQAGHMFLRYFMWNFAGKAGSQNGAGWLSPLDAAAQLPDVLENDMARNNYFMLPLLLGLIGLFFLYQQNRKMFWVVFMLFFMTGFALVLYLNSPPSEPRERDYIYVGSYFAFAIWMGLGCIPVVRLFTWLLGEKRFQYAMVTGILVCTLVPVVLIATNFDDHDRSERYLSVLAARNTLAACEKDAILFTGGDNDTYPLWYVQEVEGFRTDVRVIVLSYSNVDWYINAMFDRKNESAPIPLYLNKEDYGQGGLVDVSYVMERPELKGKSVPVRKYLDLISKKYKGIIHESVLGKSAIIPSRKFYTSTDSSKLKERDDIPDVVSDKLVDNFEFIIKGNALEKKDLLIMDILDSNKWERPIYFNFTSLNQVNFDLTGKTVQVADLYRVLPINPDKTTAEPLVDTARMYRNLITRSSYKNMDRENIHYSGNYVFFTQSRRNQFNTLIGSLISDGELDTAKEVLHKSLEYFPEEVIPLDFAGIDMFKYALVLQESDTVERLSNSIYTAADDWLANVAGNDQLKTDRRTQLHLYTLAECSRICRQNGNVECAKRFTSLFERYYNS